jgi:hypothetical protein
MGLRLATVDDNARSALDCGREAAAFGFSPCFRFASFPFRRKGQGGSCCYFRKSGSSSNRSKSGSFAAAVQSAFGTVIFIAEARRKQVSGIRKSQIPKLPGFCGAPKSQIHNCRSPRQSKTQNRKSKTVSIVTSFGLYAAAKV